MGCLKKIVSRIIFILVLVAFFAFGGWNFVKKTVNNYKNPPRDEFLTSEKNYGDFTSVSSDYQLSRSFNIFGYKKINVKYLPTGQKIAIFDLRDEKILSDKDFKNKEIDKKINQLLNSTKDSVITLEDFEIIERGFYQSKTKQIPFVRFNSKVKNIPFKNVSGIISAYSTKDVKTGVASTKLIISQFEPKQYNPKIVSDFIKAVKI